MFNRAVSERGDVSAVSGGTLLGAVSRCATAARGTTRPAARRPPACRTHLGGLGYRVGLAGKVHVAPPKAFPFEKVDGFDPNCTRNPTQKHDLRGVREFFTRQEDQPFCLVVALVEPHVPWVMGDASAYPPEKI